MFSVLRQLPWPGRKWSPLVFAAAKAPLLPPNRRFEEELLPDYRASRYYPVHIGEIFKERYQVVGKLGFGVTSTVWLARDLHQRCHVTLKIYVDSESMGSQLEHEQTIYRRISERPSRHPGRRGIRNIIESFDVIGPDGSHRCLVHPPLFESILALLRRNPVERLPPVVLRGVLHSLFLALDFLHTECHIIHTDIKADNIMLGIEDDSSFLAFEEAEQKDPSPRKVVDGRTIYLSRALQMPRRFGEPVLCDFGSAVFGDELHEEDVQPDVYRAPEVILQVPWSYKIDIWNAGCMVFDLFEGGHLFTGHDPELETYRSRAHLAEMIALLGPPPPAMIQAGKRSQNFFTDQGELRADFALPSNTSIDEIVRHNVPNRSEYIGMLRKMLEWDPAKRASAKDFAEDDWLRDGYYKSRT